MEMNFFYRIGHMYLTVFLHGLVFLFAWSLADCVCVASGLGFNGYDSNDKPKWDLLKNFDFKKIQVNFDEPNDFVESLTSSVKFSLERV